MHAATGSVHMYICTHTHTRTLVHTHTYRILGDKLLFWYELFGFCPWSLGNRRCDIQWGVRREVVGGKGGRRDTRGSTGVGGRMGEGMPVWRGREETGSTGDGERTHRLEKKDHMTSCDSQGKSYVIAKACHVISLQ